MVNFFLSSIFQSNINEHSPDLSGFKWFNTIQQKLSFVAKALVVSIITDIALSSDKTLSNK